MSGRHTTVVDLHVIVRRNNEILLGERRNTGFADGCLGLPAGHLEDGESASSGMIREAAEEIGITVDSGNLCLVHTMHHHTNTGRVALFFETTAWQGEITNREPDKCGGWQWYDVDALPEHVVRYTAEALRHIANQVSYSERGWADLAATNTS